MCQEEKQPVLDREEADQKLYEELKKQYETDR